MKTEKDTVADPNHGHGTVSGEPIGFLVPMTDKERMRRRRERRGEITRRENLSKGGEDGLGICLF